MSPCLDRPKGEGVGEDGHEKAPSAGAFMASKEATFGAADFVFSGVEIAHVRLRFA